MEKYDYTIENSNGTWITNFLLPQNVTVTFDANGGSGGKAETLDSLSHQHQ